MIDMSANRSSDNVSPTISHLLGEMAWLLTQSPLHKALPIAAIEWLCMPPILKQQFYLFRDGERPVGLALWAKCGPNAEAKLEVGIVETETRLNLEDWDSGERIWLVDLVAPFANEENRHREIMMADLISGPLKNKEFRFHRTDPDSGRRDVQVVAADAGEKLKTAIANAKTAKR